MDDTQKKFTLEEREVVLAKVEALMVRGVQRAFEIAQQVKCSLPTADSYIRAIRTRWQASGNEDFSRMRIELVEKSKELEAGYWELAKNGDNSSAKVGALNGILAVQKYQAFLAGINQVMESK